MSSPTSYDDWFAELENVGITKDPELHNNTLSAGSECNPPTAAATVPQQQQQPPIDYLSSPSNNDVGEKRPRRVSTKTTKRPRQRRQNLSQRFTALSALIPGLKKMDKTSILGETITHMKELEEKVKILEEENARKAVDSVVVVKRSRVTTVENEYHSSTIHSSIANCLTNDEQLPEIETRFDDTSVLIKIHCQMQTGVLPKIINHIENLNLVVTSSNSIAFNTTTLDINIVTEMEPDFDMSPQEVVANLRSIF